MRAPARTIRKIAIDYAISTAVWLSISWLVAWQEYLYLKEEHLPIHLGEVLLLHGVRFFTVALLTPPIFYIVEEKPIETVHNLRRALTYLAGFIPYSIVFACIRWCLLPPWMPDTHWQHRTLASLINLMYGMFADEFGIYLAILIAAHAHAYFMLIRRQELERSELRQALAQSELHALRAQLHPHFLFNTLHGIGALIQIDPACAKTMLLKLSVLLRRTLQQSQTDLVPLQDDLKFIEEFLDLEKMRLGDRLAVRWAIDPQTRKMLVPQLILLPLIENSVKHGVACYRDGGKIEIISRKDEKDFSIEIRNSVVAHARIEPGTGIGHQNIRTRLQYLYSGDAMFTFYQDDTVAVATITLPALSLSQKDPELQLQ